MKESGHIPQKSPQGPIEWMIRNRVTANLIMLLFLIGGYFMSGTITREVFPGFALDQISIRIAYPGASPEEVEEGIILAVEEAIQGLEGIKEINAEAFEGLALVRAELRDGADPRQLLQEIEQETGRITTFPVDAEDPVIALDAIKNRVLRLNIYGEVGERQLRSSVEEIRDRLLQHEDITQVEIRGGRDYEIDVSIPLATLRKYDLTLEQVAQRIRSSSVEIPGGKLETKAGEILLRVVDKSDWADEFARIPIVIGSTGTEISLGEIATVRESFEDTANFALFNRQPSLQLYLYRVGDETPIGVSKAAYQTMAAIEQDLPPQISWAITSDRSIIYKQRLDLLLKNAAVGLALVLLLLGLFLDLRLAFWVTMGIPISFLGGLLFLPMFDVSINMISMFAFIISLGLVVDDAIIAGENIYEYRQRGLANIDAAIAGARDVAMPITFSILTNIVAFLPMAFVPGVMGKIWRVIPVVVILVFLISWFESLFILPTHLAHSGRGGKSRPAVAWGRLQRGFADKLSQLTQKIYRPSLDYILALRYLTVALLLAIFIITLFYVKSGRMRMILSPRVESDRAVVTATLPYGSPLAETVRVRDHLLDSLEKVADKNGADQLLDGVYSLIESNTVLVIAYLMPPDTRPLTTGELVKLWRKASTPVGGLQSLRFESDRGGPGGGAAISVELSHRDIEILDRASKALASQLAGFATVKDIDSGYTPGKEQYNYTLNPWGASLGLTSTELGWQLRNSFQGAIALRQQRGNNEVTVRVRLPQDERNTAYQMENFLIATPAGTYVPLQEIATVDKARAYTTISRRDGRRTVTVSAGVDPIGDTPVITAALNETILPELAAGFPGLSYGYKGRQADRKESFKDLAGGFLFAMGAIYLLLAIPFRSYLQPILVMMAIPFGLIGAVLGHMIMGYHLSLMSMMGVVALSGVVVNDSLVLLDYANKERRRGLSALEAIRNAGLRRFRPVLLTTLTTFGGLAPMIFETSRQARFMIPMAISLGFGIVFATVVTLGLVPCLYLISQDFKARWRQFCS